MTSPDHHDLIKLMQEEEETIAPEMAPETRPQKRRAAQWFGFVVYGYVLVVLIVWMLIRFAGDRWWLATLLVYGPRWIYPAPLLVLIPAAIMFRRSLIFPLCVGGCLAIFSLMGLCIPWRTFAADSLQSDLRVMSYNIERYRVSGEDFSSLLDREKPDVIAVQECAGVGQWTDWWPGHKDWHTTQRGELMIASKYPIKQVEYSYSHWPPDRRPIMNAIYCVISSPQGDFGFCNVHLDTPRRALSRVLDRERILNLNNIDYADYRLECRQRESADLRKWLDAFDHSKIIAGDFNSANDGLIFRNDWNRWRDAFEWSGWGFGFTKQTIIHQHRYGLRIDYILTQSDRTPTRSWLGPDLGSDHLPLFADIVTNR